MLVAGLVVLAAAFVPIVTRFRPPVPRVTLTPGFLGTTRELVARTLAAEVRGVEVQVTEATSTEDELDKVNSGRVDFALVSGAFRSGQREHLREVAPLHVEALHLLVKPELAAAVGESLKALGGHTVVLGPSETASAALAAAVMAFVDLAPGDGTTGATFVARSLGFSELQPLIERDDRAALPDAIFCLATMPSKIVLQLVRSADYRLVPLPFAEAFRLGALITDAPMQGLAAEIDGQYAYDTVIPAFTYLTEPAVPATTLHTLGTRLLLVANDRVSPTTVERMLDAVFTSRFARITHPPLDRSVLALPPQFELHSGTVAYMHRDEPLITTQNVSELASTFSIISALIGSGLFLRQWWRRRTQDWREETFGNYMVRIADIERRAAELELSATLELEPLIELQRELLQLKSDALERFAAGEIGDQTTLSDLLMPVNGARDHIGDLILHVRDNLEEQAEAEGRTAQSLWAEATEKHAGATGAPPHKQES